jgi:cobalamin biosynthesis Co2+ chelatase CbiK
MLKEGDYNYMRNHERGLYVPDPDNNLVLLAQGTKHEIQAYYKLIKVELTNV